MNILRAIVAQTLRLHGALVDEIEHEGLEILSPKILQKELELPEICRLGFGDNLPDGSIRISIESDMVDKMERLLGNRGRLKIASIPPGILPVNQFDAEKILRKNIIFDNATFRFSESFPCVTIITSFTFSISAISNEKREEIISFSINEGSGNRADNFALLLADYERCNPSIVKLNEALQAKEWDPQTLSHSANAILPHEIKSRFEPFIAGMERRLKRDMDRVYSYYTDIQNETKKAVLNKIEKEQDNFDRERLRLSSIEREHQAKSAELVRNYTIAIEAKLIQISRVALPVHRQTLDILRKKSVRKAFVDWNPITRRLENIRCESCYAAKPLYVVCDEKLHIVCKSCMGSCPTCGREYCRVCHPKGCPRCSR